MITPKLHVLMREGVGKRGRKSKREEGRVRERTEHNYSANRVPG